MRKSKEIKESKKKSPKKKKGDKVSIKSSSKKTAFKVDSRKKSSAKSTPKKKLKKAETKILKTSLKKSPEKKKKANSFTKSSYLKPTFELNLIKRALAKLTVFLLIISLNWFGLSSVLNTFAYFNDAEVSEKNVIQAGILDFELSSPDNFLHSTIKAGESATRTISIINHGNNHKYTITADNFSSDVCDYIKLEADLNNEGVIYSGLLKDFIDFGPTIFSDPSDWLFTLTLPSDAPQLVQGQVCEFDFIFFGSQTRHNLPFGTGFTDTESIRNTINIGTEDCTPPQVTIVYPTGGEVWYLVPPSCASIPSCSAWCQSHGMNANCEYLIEWTATNTIGPDNDLLISLYFSNDSGTNWLSLPIVEDTSNTGGYLWKPPYHSDYITSSGRIKVVATHKDYPSCQGEDTSEDFCPPMLSLDDLVNFEETLIFEEEETASGNSLSGGGGSSSIQGEDNNENTTEDQGTEETEDDENSETSEEEDEENGDEEGEDSEGNGDEEGNDIEVDNEGEDINKDSGEENGDSGKEENEEINNNENNSEDEDSGKENENNTENEQTQLEESEE